jgi:hypothetical protein
MEKDYKRQRLFILTDERDIAIRELARMYEKLQSRYATTIKHNRILNYVRDPRTSYNWKYFEMLYEFIDCFPHITAEDMISASILYFKHECQSGCPPCHIVSKDPKKTFKRYDWYIANKDAMMIQYDNSRMSYVSQYYDKLRKSILFIKDVMESRNITTFSELLQLKENKQYCVAQWITGGAIDACLFAVITPYPIAYNTYPIRIRRILPCPEKVVALRTKLVNTPKINKLINQHITDNINK